MEDKTIKGLIKQVESCIDTLKAYISGEDVKIITPSIIVDDGYDQYITERFGKVSYYELEETDEAFKNYCSGLMGLSFNPRFYAEKYVELRNQREKIYVERKK